MLYSAGAPVLDRWGRVLAAMNASLYLELTDEPQRQEIIQLLLDKARFLSSLLGYSGPYPAISVGLPTDGGD